MDLLAQMAMMSPTAAPATTTTYGDGGGGATAAVAVPVYPTPAAPSSPAKRPCSTATSQPSSPVAMVTAPSLSKSMGHIPSVRLLPSAPSTSPMVAAMVTSAPNTPPASAPASSSPASAMSTSSSSGALASPELIESDLTTSINHIVRIDRFSTQPNAALARVQLAGTDAIATLLTQRVKRTLDNANIYPCARPTLQFSGQPGSGIRTAVRRWASANGINVITYCPCAAVLERQADFFGRLFRLATALTPCVVVVHRLSTCFSHDANVAAAVFDAIHCAYYSFRGKMRDTAGAPPFWLAFVDVGNALPRQWDWIEHRASVEAFCPSAIEGILHAALTNALADRLAADDVPRVADSYRPMCAYVAARHPDAFTSYDSVVQFVVSLFQHVADGLDPAVSCAPGAQIAPLDILPQEHHVELVVEQMRERAAAQRDAAARADQQRATEAYRAEQNRAHMLRQHAAVAHRVP